MGPEKHLSLITLSHLMPIPYATACTVTLGKAPDQAAETRTYGYRACETYPGVKGRGAVFQRAELQLWLKPNLGQRAEKSADFSRGDTLAPT